MTGRAGSARGLAMFLVADQATQTFMHASRSAVIARSCLAVRRRGVTLITQRLARIGTNVDDAVALDDLRHWQTLKRNVVQFSAIEQSQRRAKEFLERTGIVRFLLCRYHKWQAFVVNLVARQARNSRLPGQTRIQQSPRPVIVDRSNQVADAALKVHAMAAQAIVHKMALAVVIFVEKDLCVGRPVRTCCPAGVFLPVAGLAASSHLQDLTGFQSYLLRDVSPQMDDEFPNDPHMHSGLERESTSMAIGTWDIAVCRTAPILKRFPDLMTEHTHLAACVLVINARSRKKEDGQQHRARDQHWPAETSARTKFWETCVGGSMPVSGHECLSTS